jgi:ADP-heptose:LPS heptosyltransferase
MMGGMSLRLTAALIKHSLSHVCIDSVCNHLSAGVGNKGIVLFGRSNPYIAGHRSNVNLWVQDSCEFGDIFCGRPQGYFGDSAIYRGVRGCWVCPTRSCMKALTPEIVYSELVKVINEKLK